MRLREKKAPAGAMKRGPRAGGRAPLVCGIDRAGQGAEQREAAYRPSHFGSRLPMKAPMPSSASRASMFSTITAEACR